MNDLNANLYDLSDAQQLINELLPSQRGVTVQRKPHITANKYLNLSSINFPKQSQKKNARYEDIEKKAVEHDIALRDFESWEDIITWCMSISRAEAGFVVDSQGFVIASRGRIPSQGIEGTGAELVCSIEQLERIDPGAGRLLSVEMEFDNRRLVGFVASSGNNNDFVAGFIAPEPLNTSTKQKIVQQIIHNLPHLD